VAAEQAADLPESASLIQPRGRSGAAIRVSAYCDLASIVDPVREAVSGTESVENGGGNAA
jgi:hypothetical protein